MSTGVSAAAASCAEQQQHHRQFNQGVGKRKSAVELLAESRAAFYTDKLRDQAIERAERYVTIAGGRGQEEEARNNSSSTYALVSPSRSLPHPLLPRRHSAFSRLPSYSGSSADNSPSPRAPTARTACPPRLPKSLNASPRNAAQFNLSSYTADFDKDLQSYNANNLAYVGKKSEPYFNGEFQKNSSVLFSNSSHPFKGGSGKRNSFNNNPPLVTGTGGGYQHPSGDDLQNKLRKLLGCDATERRRSLARGGPAGGAGGGEGKEPTFRSGVGSCEDLLLGGAISPPAEYASSPQVLRSARYKSHHQHNSGRSHHSRKSQRDEGFHESHKSLPDLYARTRADEELLNRQRGYDTAQYCDESSSPQDYDRQLYREGNRSSGVYKSNSSCNRSNSSCNRSNSSCNRSTSSCNNRDSGGSSGHFTHSRSSDHASALPPITSNHNPNLLSEPYRRDSGSSTQHSYDNNSYHSINHHTLNNPSEYISHKDYNSLDYNNASSRNENRYKTSSTPQYNLTDHKINVYNSLNYKQNKYNTLDYNQIRYKSGGGEQKHRSNYYPDGSENNHPSRYILTDYNNMTHHDDAYHNNSGRYVPVNRNRGGVYESDICRDENCEVFARDGKTVQFESDCVECQRMLYEQKQQGASSKKKKNHPQFVEVCDCDPTATVFQVPEQFQDDYVQDNPQGKRNANVFAYEQHTTYLTTMTTTMTTDYRKDFHNSGASSLPPLNEGFVQNEKSSRKPADGFIRETFISTPSKEHVQGGPLSPPLGTFKRQRCLRYKNKCSSNSSGRERESKPVLRSKSDISDRYGNNKTEKITRCRSAQQPTPPSPLHHLQQQQQLPPSAQPPSSSSSTTNKTIDNQMSRVESFFDRLGLSDDTFEQLMMMNDGSDEQHTRYKGMMGLGLSSPDNDKSKSKSNSPPVFFSDTSTVDSLDQCVYDYTNTGSNNAPVQNVVRVSEPPSVVERNARIIKWLCNCRKMQLQ